MIDKLLRAKIDDAIRLSAKGAHYIGFLDPAERADAEDYIKRNNLAEFRFFGGYDEADRCVLAAFQSYCEPDESDFPVMAITITYRKQFELGHRDFLGSFMAQGITRSSIGDILIEPGKSIVFVKAELADYFVNNINKIGKVGVTVSVGAHGELPLNHSFDELSTVVASARLDCLVAAFAGLSREKASEAIAAGLIQLNYREADSVSVSVKSGDVLSVRGKGKFIVDDATSMTKKGRVVVKYRKYK